MNYPNEPQTGEQEPAGNEPEIAEVDFEAEAAKLKDLALRAHADLDNFRKRALREKEEAIRYANNGLLERLLPCRGQFRTRFRRREIRQRPRIHPPRHGHGPQTTPGISPLQRA